ncbi:transcriptional regulator, XRE family [Sulfolobus islandicus Y.G.57.14]|jgi:putative transcriptional regulator|uniref:Putative HTH-type transcriptional regulatory protein YG5714_1269 n=2 Tax=Saccharolobus islandicus TaxID=43080 RepID=Y1269_SACI7|nr:transcriptional regulator [Sulfolobus islandicus]C3NDZ6.1 RecName: Full=Putative HTH-type transcriptional regulatory protein YG5714_1269 [Sulfolobus islandicus Y.G.57.14]C3NHQ7.1 RecName: Full=Putative HTH-type transcriptional regulatory protein YN1551_1579 [Sulfolobus islandicus Y.N.15.51]ACP45535.1 transcriptional regulator, XRE family [Sulfolobus islandicus Y.G.57.14]ACP48667.1 transcriptional regulator, XRE family [Sulfolobus islandicus Y.N.15.51]PVU78591.1 transcriptional regulator [Su
MSKKIINEVIDILEDKKYTYTMIEYPEHNRKSVDIVLNSKEPTLIRVSEDKVTKEEISDLKKIAVSTLTASLVVTNEEEEDIVSVKADNVFAVSPEGFKKVINGEKIFLYRTRGGIFIKIRNYILKHKREEMGYSIGDVAKFLGVSRKAIYDYEKGDSDVSLEVAEKLIDLFGDDIIGDVIWDSIKGKKEVIEEDITEFSPESFKSKLIYKLKENGLNILSLKLTAADLIVKDNENNRYLVTIENKDYNKSMKKFYEAKKLSSYTKSELLIIIRTSKMLKECEDLGYKTYEENDIHSLIDEIKGSNGRQS